MRAAASMSWETQPSHLEVGRFRCWDVLGCLGMSFARLYQEGRTLERRAIRGFPFAGTPPFLGPREPGEMGSAMHVSGF